MPISRTGGGAIPQHSTLGNGESGMEVDIEESLIKITRERYNMSKKKLMTTED
jgi:hypothetical protein